MTRIDMKWTVIVYGFIASILGLFLPMVILFALVCLHEMGHFIVAKWTRFPVEKIELHLFGGKLITNKMYANSILQDLGIALAGPLMNAIIFLFLLCLQHMHGMNADLLDMIQFYNGLLLVFNLLPIYPLDGGRIIQYLLQFILPVYHVQRYLHLFSLIIIVCCNILLYYHVFLSLPIVFLSIYLLIENVQAWRQRTYVHWRFLLWKKQQPYGKHLKIKQIPKRFSIQKIFNAIYREKTVQYIISEQGRSYFVTDDELLHDRLNRYVSLQTIGEMIEKK